MAKDPDDKLLRAALDKQDQIDNQMAQLKLRILDLHDKAALILDSGDLEFIEGLVLLMEMDEPIDASAIPRVNKIYASVNRNSV